MDVCFGRLSEEMETAIAGMSLEQMEESPEGKWNVANILEHLAMAFGATAKMFEEKLASAQRESIPAPNLQQRIAIYVVTRVGYFPKGRKAPDFVDPTGTDAATSLRRFRENLRRMDSALTKAAPRYGSDRAAVHPIIGPMTVHQWRRFHYIHTCHHAKQVRALRAWLSEKSTAQAA